MTADWLAPGLAAAEPQLHRASDIIAVDPRGTGLSTPLACTVFDDGVSDYRSPGPRQIAAQQAAARRQVLECARQNGPYLQQISTAAMVRDMDHVRARLGVASIDFYGVSAGTWLGAHYAQTFPARVGRFVFDANTHFTADWRTSFGWQPRGFERRWRQQFLPWLARRHATYRLGTTAAATGRAYERLRAEVARGALYGLTPNDLDAMVTQALYFDNQFPELAQVLASLTSVAQPRAAVGAAAARGPRAQSVRNTAAARQRAVRAAVDRFQAAVLGPQSRDRRSTEDTVFMAVQCNDDRWDPNPASYVREGLDQGSRYPLLGYTWMTSPCAYWPYPARPLPRPTGAGVPPILMVQSELDPATAWEGAVLAHRAHASARFLAVDDWGNHGSLMNGNACVEDAVIAWLTRGVLPAEGTVCRGAPLPSDSRAYTYRLRPTGPALARHPLVAAAAAATSAASAAVTAAPGTTRASGSRPVDPATALAQQRVTRRLQQQLAGALTRSR